MLSLNKDVERLRNLPLKTEFRDSSPWRDDTFLVRRDV
jgi:hypothetical protein